jgi:hypothetical protein
VHAARVLAAVTKANRCCARPWGARFESHGTGAAFSQRDGRTFGTAMKDY